MTKRAGRAAQRQTRGQSSERSKIEVGHKLAK